MNSTLTRKFLPIIALAALVAFTDANAQGQRGQAAEDSGPPAPESSGDRQRGRGSQPQVQPPPRNPSLTPDSIQPRRRPPVETPGQSRPTVTPRRPESPGQSDSAPRRDFRSPQDLTPRRDPQAPQEVPARRPQLPVDSDPTSRREDRPQPRLDTRQTRTGVERVAPSGRVRERIEQQRDGERIQRFTPTGRKQSEDIVRRDGTLERRQFSPTGRLSRQEVVRSDGTRQVVNNQFGRDGRVRARETIQFDHRQQPVSKTVTINKTVFVNKTVQHTTVVHRYDRCRYGFVYRPVIIRPIFWVWWYDPFWYPPPGVVVVYRPFRYSWGWYHYDWYRWYHGTYWVSYSVYPTPVYWVTDYVVADYLSDYYETRLSVDRAREEARLARLEAEDARRLAQQARDEAEIAEARVAQLEAELRAKNAEEKLARLQRQEQDAARRNVAPIDDKTKEALRQQIDKTIAQKRDYAEQLNKGAKPELPDVSRSLADPEYIYPVSKVISVTHAKDSSPAGTLSHGDLVKVEPGQADAIQNATETTLLKVRVITSKGEDGAVPAGSVVWVSVKDLQDFDNEYRAKLDLALTQAEQNKDLFKKEAAGQ